MALVCLTASAWGLDFRASTLSLSEPAAAVLWSDVNGDGLADALVATRSRRLLVHLQTAQAGFAAEPHHVATLRSHTWAVCCSNVAAGGGQELLELTPSGVFVTEWSGGRLRPQEQPLVPLESQPAHDPRAGLFAWDFARDLDSDGRDEIVVPSPPAVLIFRQEASGRFALAQRVGTPYGLHAIVGGSFPGNRWPESHLGPSAAVLHAGFRCDLRAIGTFDHNRDGRRDLLVVNKVYLARPNGTYQATDEYIWPRPQQPNRYVVDLNGDGHFDTVAYDCRATIATAPVTRVTVWLGPGDKPQPHSRCRVRGVPYWHRPFVDLDGDGQQDMVVLTVEVGSRTIGSLVDRTIVSGFEYALQFCLFDNQSGFPSRPQVTKRFRTRLLGRVVAFPRADVAEDINGDGLKDLTLRDARTLSVFLLRSVRQGYPDHPDASVPLPPRVDDVLWRDLNSDGIQDPTIVSDGKRKLTVRVSAKR